MPAPKRPPGPDLIGQLLADPTRFELFQAVRLLLRWLEQSGIADPPARLRFHSRMASSFPPSELAALWARTRDNREVRTGEQLLDLLENDPAQVIHLTPASFSLLGNSSALPAHYTQTIADAERQHHDAGPRAFLDLLGTRATMQFYQAWAAHRIDSQPPGRDQFLALQLALAGAPPAGTGLPPQTLARHAALFRQRPVTAAAITAVITDYFDVPVTFQPFVGGWYLREDRLHLGAEHCTLGQGAMLGERCHRADLAAEIKIGPLRRARYEQFLPGAKGAQELTDILAMFGVVNVRYRVRLVLHAAEIEPCQLSASVGLGHGVFLHGRSGDSDDFCYDIVHPGTVRTAS